MGTDFYVPLIRSSDECPQLEALRSRKLLVTAFSDTRFSVYYFDRVTGIEQFAGSYTVTANKASSVALDVTAMTSHAANGEVPEWIAYHLVAEHPVSVHAFSAGPVECYESMVLPTNLLGKDYVVASYGASTTAYSTKTCSPDSGSSMLVVIATADSTRVTIIPAVATLTGRAPDKQFDVVLQRGQAYSVKSIKIAEASLDHTRVRSDKPVVVWGATEAADGWASPITDPDEDLRNILAQQMLPIQLWSSGPFYMAPLIDPPGLAPTDMSVGNALRFYAADGLTRVTHRSSDLSLAILYPYQPAQSNNIVSVSSDVATGPIMVEALDYRAETMNYPVTTPTLVNVLPWSAASHSAIVQIPSYSKAGERFQYLTLITLSGIEPHLTVDADTGRVASLLPVSTSLLSGLAESKTYVLGADHTYRFTSDSAFLLYQSNFFGTALTGHVQHGSANSYFFSCATPVVGRFPAIGSEQPTASASYNCDASWTVTARGSSNAPLGLATVIRDPHGDYIRLAQDSGYTSTNIAGTGPLLQSGVASAQFRVAVLDPIHDADAFVQVQNTLGVDTILHLHYTAPPLAQSTASVSFDGAPVGLDSCVSITYRNVGYLDRDTLRLTNIAHADSTFIVTTSRPLPVTLRADDSLVVTVCHIGHVESRLDTLHIAVRDDRASFCGEARVAIRSISAKTTMMANDYDFHGIVVGGSNSQRIALMNTGTANLLLASIQRTGSTAFVFTDSARLPHMLEPGASIELGFRYQPTKRGADTAYFTWISNAEGTKTVSRAIGKGLMGAVEWSDSVLTFNSSRSAGDTAFLVNATGKEFAGPVVIESVEIMGPDASEFALVSNELGYTPIETFPVAPEESVWFYIGFQPDTLRGTRDRHAQLVARDLAGNTSTIKLLGQIGTASVAKNLAPDFSITQDARTLHVRLTDEPWRLDIFDALGHSVVASHNVHGSATIDIASLPSGTYIVRAVHGTQSTATSRAFQIRR